MFFKKRSGGSKLTSYYLTSLDGERIKLRPPHTLDYAQWAELRETNRDFLQPFEPTWFEGATSQNFFERRLSRQKLDWQNDRGYAFFIFTHDNRLIGGLNLNHVCRGAAQYATLGYWLGEDAQGQGYMQEALELVMEFAANALGLHRLQAAVMPHNERSFKLLERCGFKREGFAEAYVSINGEWADHYLYGRTLDALQILPEDQA